MCLKKLLLLLSLLSLCHQNTDAVAQNLSRWSIPQSFQMPPWKSIVWWPTIRGHTVLDSTHGWPISSGDSHILAAKCSSEGRFPVAGECGQFYECIINSDAEIIATRKTCYGNVYEASTQTCVSPRMVSGCSPAQYSSHRSNAVVYPDLQKLCTNFTNKFICADCKTLVICIDSDPHPVPCQDGNSCTMNKEGFNGGAVCHPKGPHECDCNEEDSLKIDLFDPTKYLNCTSESSDPVIHSCPEGSLFNNETQTCGALTNSCSKTGRGTFTADNNCSDYFTCILSSNGWIQKWFTCPGNKMFNQDSKKCEDPCEWSYGNFTCKKAGRFHNPSNCKMYIDCIKDPLDSEKFIKIEGVCPDGYEWNQDVDHCTATGTSTCVTLTPKPSTCSIPTELCRSKALADCVSKYGFCECEDAEISPSRCHPCAEGHASNSTGCFPLCSIMTCGENESCFDKNGQAPGVCTCSEGFIRDGEQCKALCSSLTCSANETCFDKNGHAPGVCTCSEGFIRDGELCKDICDKAGGMKISNQCLIMNYGTRQTWIAAVMDCASKGQQLASLQDPVAVFEYMKSNTIDTTWIGASDEASEGTYVWMDGTPSFKLNQMPWINSNRHNDSTHYNCVHMSFAGFDDYSCTGTVLNHLCSLDITKPDSASRDSKEGIVRLGDISKQCPDDSFKVNNQCFFIPNGSFKTWDNAQAFCKSQGGFLAEPNSLSDFLEALTSRNTGYNLWIGEIQDKNIGDSSHWATGEPPSSIGKERQGEDCPLVMRGEQVPLYTGRCEDYHLFVCEK